MFYLLGISPKGPNVLLHPLECQVLVPEAKIGRHLVVLHREETERSQAVVDIDQNDIPLLHYTTRPIQICGAITGKEATAMDPNHDRQRIRGDLFKDNVL